MKRYWSIIIEILLQNVRTSFIGSRFIRLAYKRTWRQERFAANTRITGGRIKGEV